MQGALSSAVRAALAAADPCVALRESVTLTGRVLSRGAASIDMGAAPAVVLVGAGKASVGLAAAVARLLLSAAPPVALSGVVVTKDGHAAAGDVAELAAVGVRVAYASHPVPDERGAAGAAAVLAAVAAAPRGAFTIVCLSGGASALLPLPAPGLTLGDLAGLSAALLASGAPISDVNACRKHCSGISGGHLSAAAAAAGSGGLLTLAASDVVGDTLDVIGSGPTVPDESTFADALAVLDARGIAARTPPRVLAHLCAGAAGGPLAPPETPKAPPMQPHAEWLLATNRDATAAAARARAVERCRRHRG